MRDLLDLAFSEVNLEWQEFVEVDPRYFRPSEVDHLQGDATKAREHLDWSPRVSAEELVRMMVEHDLELARRERTLLDAGHQVLDRGLASG